MKNIIKIKTAIVVSALLACTILPAQAAENGVAYINFERLYQESKVVQEVRNTINENFSDREGGLRGQSEELQEMQDSLEKEALTLGKAELEKKRGDIQQLERDFVRDRRALVEDRGVVMQERRRLIDIEIAKMIEKIAEERKYSMVINPFLTLPVSGNRTLTHNIILFADGTSDITADVIARFDDEVDANLFIK